MSFRDFLKETWERSERAWKIFIALVLFSIFISLTILPSVKALKFTLTLVALALFFLAVIFVLRKILFKVHGWFQELKRKYGRPDEVCSSLR